MKAKLLSAFALLFGALLLLPACSGDEAEVGEIAISHYVKGAEWGGVSITVPYPKGAQYEY